MAWRHGEEAAVHKPRRGAQGASPLGLRRTQPCHHPSLEPQASRAARDGSSVVLRPVCAVCSGVPRKVTQPPGGVDTDPPSQTLVPLSRHGLPPPRNSSFPAPSLSQLTQAELKKQMRVKAQNRGPASAKCGLTSTLLERSFLRSQTPGPLTEPLLTPHS